MVSLPRWQQLFVLLDFLFYCIRSGQVGSNVVLECQMLMVVESIALRTIA